jgi:hypothetical protein
MPPPKADSDEKFSDTETERRFKAALLGARLAGHVPMKAKKAKKAAKKTKPKKRAGG